MKELKEFDVIGYKIKLKDDYGQDVEYISADEIVRLVNDEAIKIKKNNIGLEDGQVSALTALKIASQFLRMEQNFKEDLLNLQGNANEALDYIKDFSSERAPS